MFCVHCGEWQHDCLCVGWCYKHDCLDESPYRCQECAIEYKQRQEERRQLLSTKSKYTRWFWKLWWGI